MGPVADSSATCSAQEIVESSILHFFNIISPVLKELYLLSVASGHTTATSHTLRFYYSDL